MKKGRNSGPAVAKKTAKKRQTFDEFFKSQYKKRWDALRAAMAADKASGEFKVALWNRFAPQADMEELMEGLEQVPTAVLRAFRPKERGTLIPPPQRDRFTTLPYYILDYASVLVVEQLAVEPIHKVIDLCAAPGGKSVAIAQFLNAQGGALLTANEMDFDRSKRLGRTLADFLPKEASCPFEILQRDATRLHAPELYDRALLDAPCSAERHLLSGAGGFDLNEWTPEYTAKMATTQKSLIVRAIEMLRIGGMMTYSTCSISNEENDEVVKYALSHTRCGVELVETKLRIGEPTELGWIILPDVCDGAGPMYCATLRKTAKLRSQDDSEDEEDSSGSESS